MHEVGSFYRRSRIFSCPRAPLVLHTPATSVNCKCLITSATNNIVQCHAVLPARPHGKGCRLDVGTSAVATNNLNGNLSGLCMLPKRRLPARVGPVCHHACHGQAVAKLLRAFAMDVCHNRAHLQRTCAITTPMCPGPMCPGPMCQGHVP
eukprot:1159362-Pelagomonas_calceolata.AAC.2